MAAPAPQDPLVGKVLADRFEILSRIGEGGTGVVYKAKQIAVDRTIAIKVLGAHVSQDPSWVKRFHNEARAAAKLDHPNTVRLIDFGETREGLLFIAMEFLQGRSLADEIARIGRLPPQRVLRILMQVCASLHEAHTQGIIHRDIKPDNVFLLDMKGAGDFVKVLDFSVAKLDTPDAQATRAGTVFGTPAYMSPEQGRGVKLTPQSDIYACGILGYEMLTGKPPFEARLPMEVVMKHLRERPAPLVGFPDPVQNLIMRALEKTPERRQQSAEEMERECQSGLDVLYPRNTPGQQQVAVSPESAPGPTPPQTHQQGGVSAGPPPVAPPNPVVATPEQRTVMAQPAPPVTQSPPQPSTGMAGARTQAIQAPQSGGRTQAMDGTNATVFVPPDQIVPVPSAAAVTARNLAMQAQQQAPAVTVGPLFWVGWALIGISLGMMLHFFWPSGSA